MKSPGETSILPRTATFRSVLATILALPLIVLGAQRGLAQVQPPVPSLKPSLGVATPITTQPPAPAVPNGQHLLGNWGGLLDTLHAHGVDLVLNYLSETSANVSGGKGTGVDYADQRAVGLDINWEKLAGLTGFATHTLFVNRAGRGVGSDYVGDSLYNENEIFGGAGNVAVHLSYVYATETLFSGHLQLGGGRLSEGLFFNASPIYCSFLSFALCPASRALTGGGAGAFDMAPANEWGGYVRGRPTNDTYAQVGLFEAGSRNGGRSGFDWSTQDDDGVTVPVEIGWEPGGGAGEDPAHVKAGFYYTSNRASDVYLNANGKPLALAGGGALQHRGYFGEWAAIDKMLVRHGPGANQGLVAFANYAHTDGDISAFSDQAFGGLEDHGLIASRPNDSFGVQFTYAHQSRENQRNEELLSDQAVLSDGEPVFPQSDEMVLEAQYSAHVFNGVDLTPDLQYVIRPGATSQYNNALVLSVRLQVQL